jgi:hypothetical protein
MKPVRIAVIDTGAKIHSDHLEFIFDSRLKECRSWLDPSAGAKGLEMPAGGDEDGHGTQMVTLALRATRDTPCEVFAAQVFRNRKDQLRAGATATTQTAIARVSGPKLYTGPLQRTDNA